MTKKTETTDRALVRDMVHAPEPDLQVLDPKHVFILSGGIGAGKTTIVNRLKADFHFVSGSPADVMKKALAVHISEQYEDPDPDFDYQSYYNAMLDQQTKAEYRLLLQGWGEFFSNRNRFYWAAQAVLAAEEEYATLARAGVTSGIVFDSIRRPEEIIAARRRYNNAKHIHLAISHERQMEYLTTILGYTEEKAEATLAHSSEHWLDDMGGTDYDADYVIDANGGDELVWHQMLGIVVLMMDGPTLELAASITERPDAES